MTMTANPVGRKGGSSALEICIDGQFTGHLSERQSVEDTRARNHGVFRRIADEIEKMRQH